ncbi:FecR family protein [Chitinophaga costaii]|uniref:FecR family protein n=1 Tax=Chitinophaga costaii TaxID=1335309 RepID=A0A1C4EVT9_9BACT|nr:FecR domain-containing protein [Chitinophaga costaii]PUZ21618.1 DUF4974 domain-containing protein [Chitinophaga costaii]SCC47680.1 FecR family protein [Chitinophaga costaii]
MTQIELEILIQKYHLGISTPQENQVLTSLMENDATIRAMVEEDSQSLPPHLVDTITDQKVAHQTERMQAHLQGLHRKKAVRFYPATAAAAALLLAVGLYFWNRHPSHSSIGPTAQHVILKQEAVLLNLPGGRKINLSDTTNRLIAIDGGHLNNENKTLAVPSTAKAQVATLTVPVGKDYQIILPDATIIFLNSQTSLTFPTAFQGNTREISIDGEAYLQIAHQATKPFIVHTKDGSIEVLGTAFNINTYSTGTATLSLVSGKVRATYGKSTELSAGQQLLAQGSRQELHPFDSTKVLAWMKGILYFNNTELQDIAAVLPRWYGVEVVIDNPATRRAHFTGQVNRNRPIEEFLEAMKETASVDYLIENGILHFK